MAVKVLKNNVPLLIKAMLAVSRDEMVIGVFADGPSRAEPDAPSNSALAYVMEMGEPALNIPARPFLTTGMEDATSDMVSALKASLKQAFSDAVSLQAISGKDSAVRSGLAAAGEVAQKAVHARMEGSSFAALSPRTLQERRARGNTSTQPLIDTKQLYDAVEFRVRPKAR